MVKLSEHFTLQELTVSEWASRNGVDNTPTMDIIDNLKLVAAKLEEVRVAIGAPIHVNSGYRSPKVNKGVGGKPTSYHQYGLAADIISRQFGTPAQICQKIIDDGIKFDQLILEYPTPDGGGWVHIGIGKQMRQQVLTINSHGVFTGLHM